MSPVSVASLHRAQFWYQDIYSLLHGNCLQLRTVTEEEIDRYYLISVMERETTGHETSGPACSFCRLILSYLSSVRTASYKIYMEQMEDGEPWSAATVRLAPLHLN